MRLTPLDYVQILFYVVLMLAVILVASHAIGVLDGIEKRQQQSERHHEKIMALADKALDDHAQFLREHQAMLQRLNRPDGR